MIDEKMFFAATGRMPENDDLERCNCPDAGKIGHYSCGWCDNCQKPVFECFCVVGQHRMELRRAANN